MSEKRDEIILEWAKHYYKHRDTIFRKIDNMEQSPDKLTIMYKDGSVEVVLPSPDLEKVDLSKINPLTTVVTLNTKGNFNVLVDKWKQFAAAKDLKIIFFNSKSELEERWIIKPYFHNKIADEKSLKQGLKAMFETVQILA